MPHSKCRSLKASGSNAGNRGATATTADGGDEMEKGGGGADENFSGPIGGGAIGAMRGVLR